jgi:hypothetical protein
VTTPRRAAAWTRPPGGALASAAEDEVERQVGRQPVRVGRADPDRIRVSCQRRCSDQPKRRRATRGVDERREISLARLRLSSSDRICV